MDTRLPVSECEERSAGDEAEWGFCENCGQTFPALGPFCDEACRDDWQAREGRR